MVLKLVIHLFQININIMKFASFDLESAEALPNGLWMYPQHKIMHELLDGMLHWLLQHGKEEEIDIKIVDHSSGPDYEHANYIEIGDLQEFFA